MWTPDRLPPIAGDADVDAVAETVTPSDTLAIMFTSGSSGPPKGVIHSHGNALGAVRSGLAARCIDADTRLYLPMPFFWVGGFGSGVLSALLAGATLVTEQIPRPETTLRLLERERVTLFRGWPDQAEALARQTDSVAADLSALAARQPGGVAAARTAGRTRCAGEAVRDDRIVRPLLRLSVPTPICRGRRGAAAESRSTGMEVRIVDPDTGRPLPTGAVGMIQIRGPHVMRGICRRSREDLFTADGYYPTGDLGHLDDDGFMFYHGRSDDMFKVSGATVYPSEVEQALRTIDGVDNAFVTEVSGAVGAVVISETPVERPARRGAKAAELLQGSDGMAAGGLRRRHPARHDRQGRRPQAAGLFASRRKTQIAARV